MDNAGLDKTDLDEPMRARVARRRVLVGALLAVYLAFALYPFKWAPPVNTAQWLPAGGIAFHDAGVGLARTNQPPEWLPAAMRSHRLTIRLRVRPEFRDQTGPARIMSLSADHYRRNFSIAQEGAQLVLRLRTPATDLNGMPDIRVPAVFSEREWVDLAVMIEPGRLRIAVDGDVRARKALGPRPLKNWDPAYRLALGNEMTGARPWFGRIARTAVRTGGATIDYATHDALTLPSLLWTKSVPTVVPFTHMQARDTIVNILGFIPLGWLLGDRVRFAWRAIVFIAGVSIGLELLQLCFAERDTSVNDLICNTLGGAIGIIIRQRWRSAVKS